MKKRFLTISIVALLAVMTVSAAVTEGNRQKVYSVDSPEWEAIKYLYIAEGKALPSTTGPWSAAELDIMADRLDPEGMSGSILVTYDWLMERLGRSPRLDIDEAFGAEIGLKVGIDATYHTNAKDFTSPDFLGGRGDWKARLPLFSVPLETWIGDFVYGYSSLDIGLNRSFNKGIKDVNFMTNIYMVPPCQMDDLNFNFPLRAFGSLGGDHWNFEIGREKLSWGPGESGNLMIGDHIPYHNNARFTAFSDKFKYTFLLSNYTHPMNYVNPDNTIKFEEGSPYADNRDRTDYWQSGDKKGLSAFISHRLEWRIIDKIGMALTESIMYQSESNKFDLMVLSPTAVFHNYYIRGNANSLLSFDVDYTPIKYLNLYGSFIVDEFQLPGECDPVGPPSAHGWIAGAKTSVPLGDGMIYGSLEGAYTDPYLYLRDAGKGLSNDVYGINFVVATPEFGNSWGDNYTLDFLGYRYGNDSFVANANVGYKVFGKWFVDAEYTYIGDGTMDMHTKWWDDVAPGSKEDGKDKNGDVTKDKNGNVVASQSDPKAPTKDHPDKHGSFDPKSNWKDRNDIAHWNIISLRGGVTLFEDLDIWGEMNYISVLNYRNVKGEKADDFQVSIGISYYV